MKRKGKINMATLYEMSSATRTLYEMLMNDEIDEQTFNDTVEGMGAIEKVEGYCQIISQLNAESDMFKAEIERLAKKKSALDNRVKWLKSQLYDFYLANGCEKIKAGTFTVSVRKSECVDIPDISKIPKKYCNVTVSPDKTAIKAALKQGLKVSGAEIVSRESVQIK